jgi:hypothetical protein
MVRGEPVPDTFTFCLGQPPSAHRRYTPGAASSHGPGHHEGVASDSDGTNDDADTSCSATLPGSLGLRDEAESDLGSAADGI